MQVGMKLICALAMTGAVLGMSASAHADSLTVKTEQGKVHGKTINDGKVKAYLGLPYAAPPVGNLRWKAPDPPAKWKGERGLPVFECLYATRCKRREQFAGDVLDSRRRLFRRRKL